MTKHTGQFEGQDEFEQGLKEMGLKKNTIKSYVSALTSKKQNSSARAARNKWKEIMGDTPLPFETSSISPEAKRIKLLISELHLCKSKVSMLERRNANLISQNEQLILNCNTANSHVQTQKTHLHSLNTENKVLREIIVNQTILLHTLKQG